MADYVLDQSTDEVVTNGFDDTRKAAGVRAHDIKTDHVSIISDEGRKIYTRGFASNLSHSAKDQTTTLKHKLHTFAAFAGGGTTEQYIIDHINFGMYERASDNYVVLQNLGVKDEKILNCTACILLGIDDALENAFKEFKQKVGRDVLAVAAIRYKGNSSIILLGLLVLTKCLGVSRVTKITRIGEKTKVVFKMYGKRMLMKIVTYFYLQLQPIWTVHGFIKGVPFIMNSMLT